MKRISISFIIPYYNTPFEMLHACISSILDLSLEPEDHEILVVDDGSAEDPEQELFNYFGAAVRCLHQGHLGVSAARNLALGQAQHEYIQFIDADDMLITSVYRCCLDIMRYAREDVDMLMFDYNTSGTFFYKEVRPVMGRGAELMLSRNISGVVWGYLFRKSIMGDLEFSVGTSYGEDEEFTALLLLRAQSVACLNLQAYQYRTYSGSATRQKDMLMDRLHDSRAVIMRLHNVEVGLRGEANEAMKRKVAQLTMDYLYNVIRFTRSSRFMEKEIKGLRRGGLFPLPEEKYTGKYMLFRYLSTYWFGRKVLFWGIVFLDLTGRSDS